MEPFCQSGYFQLGPPHDGCWPLTIDLKGHFSLKATFHLTISMRGQRATAKFEGLITITGVLDLL